MSQRHYSPRSVAIVGAEATWVFATLALALLLEGLVVPRPLTGPEVATQFVLAGLLYLSVFSYAGLYSFSELHVRRELVTATIRAFSLLALVFGMLFLLSDHLAFVSTTILVHLGLTALFILFLRTHVDGILHRHSLMTRTAIVGTGVEARGLAEEILRRHEYGHTVSCFVAAGANPSQIDVPGGRGIPVVEPGKLLEFVESQGLRRILVATADLDRELPLRELLQCKAAGYEVEDGHTFYERLLGRILTAQLRPEWLIFSDGFTRSAGARAIKRVIDVLASVFLLLLTAPLYAIVALLIKLEDGGPIRFGQERVGRNGRLFKVFKLRSMRINAEAASGPKWAEENDPRVTRVGRWIRAMRIDEIPQAWNVLRGDMSFVGPRPERPEFVTILTAAIPFYDYRHAVRPGITGWAQVRYPYGATVEDSRAKLEYDLYYLKNFSVLMDLFILLRTVKIILFGWGSR
jgi:sugar transferase (PEP-CTERM system associated)